MWNEAHAWALIEKLVGLAVALQTIELLQIREELSERGVWRWSALRGDYATWPRWAQNGFDVLLRYPNFVALLGIRLGLCVAIVFAPSAPVAWILLASSLLVTARWRGTFNGGSDYLTVVALTALAAALTWPAYANAALWYLTVQVVLSYFVAGCVKLKTKNWRTGRALKDFLGSAHYAVPSRLNGIIGRPHLLCALSWGVIIFECSFPIALRSGSLCLAYLAAGLVFHLTNFYVFGLNRFVFAWLAAYPALYYCSQYRF